MAPATCSAATMTRMASRFALPPNLALQRTAVQAAEV